MESNYWWPRYRMYCADLVRNMFSKTMSVLEVRTVAEQQAIKQWNKTLKWARNYVRQMS